MGHEGGPFVWSPERRIILRSEIDAAMLHLYGLSRKQSEILIDSFTVVRKYEERDYGEFRTKRLVMATYDAMAKAQETGTSYVTPLSPPPADPSLCHPTPSAVTPMTGIRE